MCVYSSDLQLKAEAIIPINKNKSRPSADILNQVAEHCNRLDSYSKYVLRAGLNSGLLHDHVWEIPPVNHFVWVLFSHVSLMLTNFWHV